MVWRHNHPSYNHLYHKREKETVIGWSSIKNTAHRGGIFDSRFVALVFEKEKAGHGEVVGDRTGCGARRQPRANHLPEKSCGTDGVTTDMIGPEASGRRITSCWWWPTISRAGRPL